jgi:hypothetical protein
MPCCRLVAAASRPSSKGLSTMPAAEGALSSDCLAKPKRALSEPITDMEGRKSMLRPGRCLLVHVLK